MKYPRKIKTGIKGVTISQKAPGAPFQVKVFDSEQTKITGETKHITKRWATEAEARAWGATTFADVTKGIVRAGRLTISALMEDYITWSRGEGNKEPHLKEARGLLMLLTAKGLDNLKALDLARRTNALIGEMKDRRQRGPRARPPGYVAKVSHKKKGQEAPKTEPRPLSAATRRRFAQQLKAFGNWCLKEENNIGLTHNPFQAVSLAKLTKTIKTIYSAEECLALASDEALGMKHGLYFFTLLNSGQRERECAWLRWSHFKWAEGLIHVQLPDDIDRAEAKRLGWDLSDPKKNPGQWKRYKNVKGDSERLIDLEPELIQELRKHAKLNEDYVFPEWYRQTHNVDDALSSHLKALGHDRGSRKVHTLRANYGCLRLAAGVDMQTVQISMGHADSDTTMTYTGASRNLFRMCQDWGRRIKLREAWRAAKLSKNCPKKAPVSASLGQLPEAEAPDAEDDINGELYVVLNDFNGLETEPSLPLTGTDGGHLGDYESGGWGFKSLPARHGDKELELPCPS